LEKLIEMANLQYSNQGIAEIQKIPSRWLPIRNKRGEIVSAKIEEQSTVDFIGRYIDTPIAFDAKSVLHENKWYLRKLEPHQYEFLKKWSRGGLSFILLGFWATEEFFLLPFDYIQAKYIKWEKGGGASVKLTELKESFPVIKPGGRVVLDYLSVINAKTKLKEVALT